MPTIGYIEKRKGWTEYLHRPAFVSICVHGSIMISPEQPTSKPYALPVSYHDTVRIGDKFHWAKLLW